MYDIIIIGAGPAGLSAAIYAQRASKSVLVLEANTYGGQIVNTPDIENYPVEEHISGFEFATKLYTQAVNLGAQLKFERALEIVDSGAQKTVKTAKSAYTAKTVIVASGAENRKLGIEREDEMLGKGISYCATCDGAFYRGKTVAVVGGGNTALEDALYLADVAEKVYLIHRRDAFRADNSTVEKLKKKENIELVLCSNVTKLVTDNKLTAIEVTNQTGVVRTLQAACLFVAVGRIPENQSFENVLELDGEGYAVAAEDCTAKTQGIFVAGDNRAKQVRQLVTACADGAVAATNAVKYINSLQE